MAKRVHVVSHCPHCLDGVTAAAAVARYYEGRAEVLPHFASNSENDAVLRGLPLDHPDDRELWITDISWREPATDAHLRELAGRGVSLFWIDHHRPALQRHAAGDVQVTFPDKVLSEDYAASRLTYDFLAARAAHEADAPARFPDFRPVVEMADDNDRWLHRIEGSRELAWVVRALGPDSFADIAQLGPDVTYTPRMAAARDRVGAEIARSFRVAEASRTERTIGDVTLVVAICDGHPSEIADTWGKRATRTVFALYDASSLAVSLRRSPDCDVDLSRLASSLGGGGHAAAAGCELPELRAALAELVAARLAEKLA
jgi:oligoribonuclease NrnB/cAMP/cGMP phosphodiesterase (DHH superfamily)